MALFTSSYLRGVYSKNINSLNESFRTRNFSATINSTFDIFLSHSFLDREDVLGLYTELRNHGFSVYVDWIVDPQLDRNNVTKESAALLRARMQASKTLLLAISHNASVSKWMPWELGYVDGKTGFCAIVPISKDNQHRYSYQGVEYLSLYPYLDSATTIGGEPQIWINDSDGAYASLYSWIVNKTKPYKR